MPMPVHAMPAGLSLDMTPSFACSHGPRCEILCNDKPAWFKGGFPCLGKLTVKCESGEDSPDWAPNFIAASCKGFWSGIFGRTVCLGAPHLFVLLFRGNAAVEGCSGVWEVQYLVFCFS